jgi:DNA transposition AAA+ family ATPase
VSLAITCGALRSNLEKRLARYPQFYSRIGFVHEFRPLSQSEMRQLLLQRWMPPDLAILKVAKIDPDAIATIIRVTNGNFRLLHRLLTQIERILEINSRIVLTKGVVEAARQTLVSAKCKAPHTLRSSPHAQDNS